MEVQVAMRISPTLPFALMLGLLCGCATMAKVAPMVQLPAAEPDCSFRAGTSCWTLAVRFPASGSEPTDSQPIPVLNLPAVLATEADSTSMPQ